MALSYTVTDDYKVILKSGNETIDTVGPWDSAEGAQIWGEAVCDKYNSAEYAGVDYPNSLPEEN